MKHTVSANWLKNMSFEGDIDGHKILIDAKPEHGGENKGPTPKPFMLLALAGCTAMDVVSILGKMQVQFDDFNVSVEGELTDEFPRHYNKMHVIYEFKGKNLPLDKIQKAISLSEDKYCGVNAVYKKTIEMSSEIRVKL
ncbi:MAG: osmotically inducible protein C [Bacteroidetes bacterium GWA2_30_7]|nr:MAG: osmotically inducible protein C [Bacteroidetes bacterium GWA2_30_7]